MIIVVMMMMMMMIENSIKLKIIKTHVSKMYQVELSLFKIYFRFFKIYFSKSRQERGEGWGGVVQEHESR